MLMHPIAAWLALNGWEPYVVTGKSRYVFLGASVTRQHREMIMMWPEVGVSGNTPTIQLVPNGTIRKTMRKLEWNEVREMYLELAYQLLKEG